MSYDSKKIDEISRQVRLDTIEIHRLCQATRIASSLSIVELLVVLHYTGIRKFFPSEPNHSLRDRLIISKGHGSICMYPILADLGFFDRKHLLKVGQAESFLGGIPDPSVPGYESTNGSLGHGLGIGGGVALYLKNQFGNNSPHVYILISDGELYEGSIWEASMFIGAHKLKNITLMIDYNKKAMLGPTDEIIPLGDIPTKFRLMGWNAFELDGHNSSEIYKAFQDSRTNNELPTVMVANTVKGKGVRLLEDNPLSHIANLSPEEISAAVLEINNMQIKGNRISPTNAEQFSRSIY